MATSIVFRTKSGGYLYSAISNEILRFSECDITALERLSATAPTCDRQLPEHLSHLLHEGVVDDKHFRGAVQVPCENHLASILATELQQVTLEVTENCNLRCSYCPVAWGLRGTRSAGNEMMESRVALAAVEYLAEHSARSDHPALGFYGGEPLLNLPVVVLASERARQLLGERLIISLTTNGTRITDDAVRFLEAFDVSLLVSLDGPKASHNRNRRSPSNSDSWTIVIDGLRMIKCKAPNYFARKVRIACVLGSNCAPSAAADFFASEPVFDDLQPSFLSVTTDSYSADRALIPSYRHFRTELRSFRQKYISDMVAGNEWSRNNAFTRALFDSTYLQLYKRSLVDPASHDCVPLNGMCIPGQRKLFVSVDGTLYACERVNRAYPLGSVYDGINVRAVHRLLTEFAEHCRSHCLDCYAARLCGTCVAPLSGPTGLDVSLVGSHCEAARRSLLLSLVTYCNILEANPTAFDHFEDVHLYPDPKRRGE